MSNQSSFLDKVKSGMSEHAADIFNVDHKPQAAVLVPLVSSPEPSVLLTLRAAHLKSHPGQVSFPGGMLEVVDQGSKVAAALRETDEEITLSADQFTVLGELSTTISKDGVLVYPVLASIESAEKSAASPDEIADIFTVPWQFFVDTPPELLPFERQGVHIQVPHYYYGGHHIWGLTAMILLELINIVEGTQWPVPAFSKMQW